MNYWLQTDRMGLEPMNAIIYRYRWVLESPTSPKVRRVGEIVQNAQWVPRGSVTLQDPRLGRWIADGRDLEDGWVVSHWMERIAPPEFDDGEYARKLAG